MLLAVLLHWTGVTNGGKSISRNISIQQQQQQQLLFTLSIFVYLHTTANCKHLICVPHLCHSISYRLKKQKKKKQKKKKKKWKKCGTLENLQKFSCKIITIQLMIPRNLAMFIIFSTNITNSNSTRTLNTTVCHTKILVYGFYI